jgi:hypothetical protein
MNHEPRPPGLPATWIGRTILGSGSALGLTGLSAVSPTLAVTAVAVTGAVAITALIVRALPVIIRTRSIAKTAKRACDSPQAERALRVLIGPEYPERKAPATRILSLMIGEAPDAAPGPGASPEAVPDPAQGNKTPGEVLTVVPKLAA